MAFLCKLFLPVIRSRLLLPVIVRISCSKIWWSGAEPVFDFHMKPPQGILIHEEIWYIRDAADTAQVHCGSVAELPSPMKCAYISWHGHFDSEHIAWWHFHFKSKYFYEPKQCVSTKDWKFYEKNNNKVIEEVGPMQVCHCQVGAECTNSY